MGVAQAPVRRGRTRAVRLQSDPPGAAAAPASASAQPRRLSAWVQLVALAVGGLLLEGLLGWQAGFRPIVWLTSLLAALAGAVASALCASRATGPLRVSWALVSASAGSLLAGLVYSGEPDLVGGPPSEGYALWLAAAPVLLLAAALVRLEWTTLPHVSLRLSLDIAACTLAWVLAGLLLDALIPGDPERPRLLAYALSGLYLTTTFGALGIWREVGRSRAGDRIVPAAVLALALAGLAETSYLLDLPPGGLALREVLWLLSPAILARAALQSAQRADAPEAPVSAQPWETTRLGLVPAVASATVVVLIAAIQLVFGEPQVVALYPGLLTLFAIVTVRLLLTVTDNRRLLKRLLLAGSFEADLRDLGIALTERGQPERLWETVCQRAREMFDADMVCLWLPDRSRPELVAEIVVGSYVQELHGRRINLADRTFLAARVFRSGQTAIVNGAAEARRRDGYHSVITRSQCVMAVPVRRGRETIGVLELRHGTSSDAYGEMDRIRAELLAAHAASALENTRLFRDLHRRLEEAEALYKFTHAVNRALTRNQVAARLLDVLRERPGYRGAAVFLTDSSSPFLQAAASQGEEERTDLVWAPQVLRPSSIAGRAFALGEPQRGIVSAPRGRGEPRAQLAVPLLLKDKAVGVVELWTAAGDPYSAEDERLVVSLAQHAALAVDNLFLVEEARKVQALKELDRLKSELLATVSHELRTPLASIKGYTSTLLNYDQKFRREEKRQFLHDIDEEADRLEELIGNLLDMSRLEAGVLRIEKSSVDLGRIIAEAVERARARTSRHQITFGWAGPAEIEADARRIRQVINNLLENAIKYSPDGGVIAVTGRIEGGSLLVQVQDEGAGLPAREVERIFDRFHRVDGELARKVGGTGLGLAICKGLIEAHGGRIWAESPGPGRGSTFAFTLPLDAPAAARAAARSRSPVD